MTIESAENLLKKALPKGVRIKKQLDRGKFSAWIEDTGEQLSFEMEDLRDIFDEKNEDNTLKALTEFYNECRNALGHPACSSSDQSVDTDDI